MASLIGNWDVKCPHCAQVDPVDGVTMQHKCSKCKQQTRVNDGFYVKCTNPNCSQADHVAAVTTAHQCSVCGHNMP